MAAKLASNVTDVGSGTRRYRPGLPVSPNRLTELACPSFTAESTHDASTVPNGPGPLTYAQPEKFCVRIVPGRSIAIREPIDEVTRGIEEVDLICPAEVGQVLADDADAAEAPVRGERGGGRFGQDQPTRRDRRCRTH